MHRQELATNYADDIDFSKVDLVITVSALFFERLLERFPNIPRKKVRLIPNYIDADAYKKEWHPDRLFNLAMIGILPSRKNFHISLEVLKELRKKDSRYNLSVYSKRPQELAWLARNKDEMAYFDKCEKYIVENNLSNSVEFKGHCDLKKALSDHKIGFVLSVSASDEKEFPGPESFHLAIADGFAGGGVSLIKKWAGCEYIFPGTAIFESTSGLVEAIQGLSADKDRFKSQSKSGVFFLKENYALTGFVKNIKSEVSAL
ncbi:MAG: hypothetical protein MZV65_38795 [Chromatiales bacterium]|nr:hypothetical protein [Chromatiales bacterium]